MQVEEDKEAKQEHGQGEGIVYTQTTASKLIIPIFLALIALAILAGYLPSNPLLWAVWLMMVPYALVHSPDFTVYEDGIAVHFPWKTKFNTWNEVRKVRRNSINARIYARHLTVFNTIFGFGTPWIMATGAGREGYNDAMERIKGNIGERFIEAQF